MHNGLGSFLAGLLLAASSSFPLCAAPEQARPADALVDSLGVNTHFGYTDKPYFTRFNEVKVKLGALGVRHIRESADGRDYVYQKINELHTAYGIKAIQGIGDRVSTTTPWCGKLDTNKIDAKLDIIKAFYLSVNEGIEGPNEYDVNHSGCGADDPQWVNTLREYTAMLYAKVKTDPLLSSRLVVQPSLAHAGNAPQVGDLSPWIDAGNMHPYPGGWNPNRSLEDYNMGNVRLIYGTRPVWATETGYHNATNQTPGGHNTCPEQPADKYGPRLLAEYFRLGIARAYFYEFMDEGTNLANQEDNFGLIRFDLSEKPIYGALKRFLELLRDPGPAFAAGWLDYSLAGNLTDVRRLVLQKRNGDFYLLLWQEVVSYDVSTRTVLNVPARTATLTFGQPVQRAELYHPTYSNTVVATFTNPATLNLAVPDHVLVVKLAAAPGPRVSSLLPAGAEWKYHNGGTDLGTAWREPAYADMTWASGPAQLGAGDGDEARVIDIGPSNARYPTIYFRRQFTAENPAVFTNLVLRVVRDDGAAVYLNGREVWRNNLPAGALSYQSWALTAVGGTDESTWLETPLNPASLIAGTNLLAVEVHQNTNTSSDLSFDLELYAVSPPVPQAPLSFLMAPTNGTRFGITGQPAFRAEAYDWDGQVREVAFYANGTCLGRVSEPPYLWTWTNAPIGHFNLTAVAVDDSGRSATSAVAGIVVTGITTSAQQTLIPRGSTWRYRDTGVFPGAAWTSLNFADSGWASGQARLGYGGDGEITRVSYGGVSTNKHLTTWFRRMFTVTNASRIQDLVARLSRDDGAAVYLNGVELFRSNLPTSPLTPTTRALSSVGGTDETTYWPFVLAPTFLVDGTNVVAVEVHQSSSDSSDLGFDLELIATLFPDSPPLAITRGGNAVQVSWPAAAGGFGIETAPEATGPWTWWPYRPGLTNGRWQLPASPEQARHFYRLRLP